MNLEGDGLAASGLANFRGESGWVSFRSPFSRPNFWEGASLPSYFLLPFSRPNFREGASLPSYFYCPSPVQLPGGGVAPKLLFYCPSPGPTSRGGGGVEPPRAPAEQGEGAKVRGGVRALAVS